jgi:Tol biopolymer transport system component
MDAYCDLCVNVTNGRRDPETTLDAATLQPDNIRPLRPSLCPGLFKIPVDGGAPIRLVAGQAINPVWSPDRKLIVYAGTLVAGEFPLAAVTPDGAPVEMPPIRVGLGGGYRFLPDGKSLVYLPGRAASPDFWRLDFATRSTRQLTHLDNRGAVRTFDITRDGRNIVFDRSRENSDIVLIDLGK